MEDLEPGMFNSISLSAGTPTWASLMRKRSDCTYFGCCGSRVKSGLRSPGSRGRGGPPRLASLLWRIAVASSGTPLPLDKLYVSSSVGKLHQANLTTGADLLGALCLS